MVVTKSFVFRVLTALVLIPLVLFLTWSPELHLPFTLFIAALAGGGLYEYYALARRCQISPETIGGIVAGTLVALSGHHGHLVSTTLALYCACLLVVLLHILRGQYSVAGLAATVFGMVYVGWFAAHMVLLRSLPNGPGLVTLLLFAVAITDAGAYITGSLMGRHKMAPKVSPGKTWEGAAGGLVLTLAVMMIFHGLRLKIPALPQWGAGAYLLIGAILSVVGQIGDLVESSMKRAAGVKDSGNVFPGHGGVLDRCDSYLFTAPVMYYLVAPLFHG